MAFGWTWADQDIQIQGMVHHAGEALQLEKQRHGKGKGAWGQQAFWGLEEAFAKGHFHIYLQPKAEIASGRIRGAEALIRYRDDQHGVVGPDKFIPQLERSGLIRHIDLFVLEEVCRTLRRWREQGVEPIPISLNLSRYTLMEKGILARINGIISRYQVDRRLLKLEITEFHWGCGTAHPGGDQPGRLWGTATASPWTDFGAQLQQPVHSLQPAAE